MSACHGAAVRACLCALTAGSFATTVSRLGKIYSRSKEGEGYHDNRHNKFVCQRQIVQERLCDTPHGCDFARCSLDWLMRS